MDEEAKEENKKCNKDEKRLSVSYSKEEEKSLIHMGSGGEDGRGQLVVERRGRGGEGGGGGSGLLIDLAPPRLVEVDRNPSTNPLVDREQEEEDMMMSFTQ